MVDICNGNYFIGLNYYTVQRRIFRLQKSHSLFYYYYYLFIN